eukprot:RCo003493
MPPSLYPSMNSTYQTYGTRSTLSSSGYTSYSSWRAPAGYSSYAQPEPVSRSYVVQGEPRTVRYTTYHGDHVSRVAAEAAPRETERTAEGSADDFLESRVSSAGERSFPRVAFDPVSRVLTSPSSASRAAADAPLETRSYPASAREPSAAEVRFYPRAVVDPVQRVLTSTSSAEPYSATRLLSSVSRSSAATSGAPQVRFRSSSSGDPVPRMSGSTHSAQAHPALQTSADAGVAQAQSAPRAVFASPEVRGSKYVALTSASPGTVASIAKEQPTAPRVVYSANRQPVSTSAVVAPTSAESQNGSQVVVEPVFRVEVTPSSAAPRRAGEPVAGAISRIASAASSTEGPPSAFTWGSATTSTPTRSSPAENIAVPDARVVAAAEQGPGSPSTWDAPDAGVYPEPRPSQLERPSPPGAPPRRMRVPCIHCKQEFPLEELERHAPMCKRLTLQRLEAEEIRRVTGPSFFDQLSGPPPEDPIPNPPFATRRSTAHQPCPSNQPAPQAQALPPAAPSPRQTQVQHTWNQFIEQSPPQTGRPSCRSSRGAPPEHSLQSTAATSTTTSTSGLTSGGSRPSIAGSTVMNPEFLRQALPELQALVQFVDALRGGALSGPGAGQPPLREYWGRPAQFCAEGPMHDSLRATAQAVERVCNPHLHYGSSQQQQQQQQQQQPG